MPYVDRKDGKIISTYNRKQREGQEFVKDDVSELQEFETKDNYQTRRRKNIADGGYGTWQEQLEMIQEKGINAWKNHCAQVKLDHPKT